MALPDPAYVAQPPIQQYFVEKTDGTPLAGGFVKYYRDTARTIAKSVYIQQQQPDNSYLFLDIGNVITLSNVGTPQYNGTDFIPFLWPYLGSPTDVPPSTVPDLYFVQVYSSGLTLQETREAWPPNATSGGTNPTDLFEGSGNAISNPQFARINFVPDAGSSTYTLSVTGTGTETQIAPDWSLITSGADTITLQQLDISDANTISNPPYALAIQSGASITSMVLRQKFAETPRLFANGYVNGSVVAASTGSIALPLTLKYTQSNGSSFTIVAGATSNDNLYSTIQGSPQITPVTSTDSAPTGYSTFDVVLPLGSLIKISSAQLVSVQNASSSTEFLQEPVARQIDHLYHDAYPVVPVGTVIDYLGFDNPLHYLPCDGATAYSRVQYQQLFRAITVTETVSLTSGVATFTVVSAAKYFIGMPLEGTGVAASTTISNIVGTTITMSNNATATTSSLVRFFLAGAGNGSTTFNTPDLRGYVTAGWGNTSVFAAANNGIGGKGGSSTHAILMAEMPSHNHTGSTVSTTFTGYNTASGSLTNVIIGSGGGSNNLNLPGTLTIAAAGGGTLNTSGSPMTLVQQTALVQKYIRYE